MASRESNIVKRGVASKRKGKLRLTEPAKKWLRTLLRAAEKRRLLRVKAAKPTWKTKRVLFVCFSGLWHSNMSLIEFERVASMNPISTDLLLDQCGVMDRDLKEKAGKADFIVMALDNPRIQTAVKEAVQGLRKKPELIDLGLQIRQRGLFDPKVYGLLLEKIKKKIEKEK